MTRCYKSYKNGIFSIYESLVDMTRYEQDILFSLTSVWLKHYSTEKLAAETKSRVSTRSWTSSALKLKYLLVLSINDLSHRKSMEYWPWSAKTLLLSLFTAKPWLISGVAVERTRAQSQGFQSKQPHIAAPHHCLFIPLHPTWQTEWVREREAQTRHRGTERHLAVNPGLAGFGWTAVSNKVSRLKEKQGEKWSTSQQSNAKRKAAEEEEGDGWWRDFDKSLNDRGAISPNREDKVQWVHWLVDTQV